VRCVEVNADVAEAESVVLDVGPTTLLNADVGRAKMNVRQRNKRAPTAALLRQRAEDSEVGVDNDEETAVVCQSPVTADEPGIVSCSLVDEAGFVVSWIAV